VIHAKLDWSKMLQACAAPVKLDPSIEDLIVSSATTHAIRAAIPKLVTRANLDRKRIPQAYALTTNVTVPVNNAIAHSNALFATMDSLMMMGYAYPAKNVIWLTQTENV